MVIMLVFKEKNYVLEILKINLKVKSIEIEAKLKMKLVKINLKKFMR
jgi:hypothetical protein|tara:strand:+ start:74 stop:214 length:141 start_codon:yes stop_codon:yes gene_type:complete